MFALLSTMEDEAIASCRQLLKFLLRRGVSLSPLAFARSNAIQTKDLNDMGAGCSPCMLSSTSEL